MRYVISRTTDGRKRGVVIEGADIQEVINNIGRLFRREFSLVADKEVELIVNDGHILVVLKLKEEK